MKNNFYTYAYLREDSTPYYIGKGSGDRYKVKQGRNCSPPSDDSRIIFLKKGLTEEEAFRHEIYMIFLYGRKDTGTGILYNFTDGGEGASGISEETRKKQKEVGRRVLDPNNPCSINNPRHPKYGKGGKVAGKKSCDPNNPRGVNNPNHPSYHERNKRNGERAIREQGHIIEVTDTETGEVKTFPSIRAAARELQLSPGTLNNVVNPNHSYSQYRQYTARRVKV